MLLIIKGGGGEGEGSAQNFGVLTRTRKISINQRKPFIIRVYTGITSFCRKQLSIWSGRIDSRMLTKALAILFQINLFMANDFTSSKCDLILYHC